MRPQKILLASETKEDNLLLRKQIGMMKHSEGELRFLESRPEMLAHAPSDVHLAILCADAYSVRLRKALLDLRFAGFSGPTIMIAKSAGSLEPFQLARKIGNLVYVERPYVPKDLVGIARKMIATGKVAQRVHRRFATSQRASVEFFNRDLKSETTLHNLSRGGAFFELDDSVNLKQGELLKLHIDLDEVNRTYAMAAKVVWCGRSGFADGRCGVGVEFVRQGDVYKYLLESV